MNPPATSLSHVDEQGQARMVDVSAKPRLRRTARATGCVLLQAATLDLIRQNAVAKGDVLACARLAGIMGGKRTSELIPLCHNIAIEQLSVDLELGEDRITIHSQAVCSDKTGIEMEALTAVSLAALTIYDMVKAVDRTMVIGEIRLVEKTKAVQP